MSKPNQARFSPWGVYKSMFFAWEKATAELLEKWLQNPALLEPAGAWLSSAMKIKAASAKASASWWGGLGLPTKQDQERQLHLINQLHSRIMDLEERLPEPR